MDEKDYLILQYLYEDPNLTKAAERLFMTQPALTYRLRQIEKEFQIEIFSRHGKNFKFTPAGEHLVSYSKRMMADLRRTKEYLLNMGSEVKGSLKIGVNNYFGLYFLPSVLEKYITSYPNVHLNVDTGFSTEIMELLVEGEIDIAVVRGDYNWFDQKCLLGEENICIISKKEIRFDELPKLPMINRKEPSVLLKYKNVPYVPRDQSFDFWWNERFEDPPIITMQVDSYETCKEMVKRGLGYAIIPRAFLHENNEFYCKDLVFRNGQTIKRRTWMLYRRSSLQLATVSEFVNYIKQVNDPIC